MLFASVPERPRSYRLEQRPVPIAANLLLDTMHATLAELKRAQYPVRWS